MGRGPAGLELIFFYFFRVGGPEGNELRQFVALTTGNGTRRAGGRARAMDRGAITDIFGLLIFFELETSH